MTFNGNNGVGSHLTLSVIKPQNKHVRIAVFAGGSWQPYAAQFAQIGAGRLYDVLIVFDVRFELERAGITPEAISGLFTFSPLAPDSIGVLVDDLGSMKDPNAQRIADHMRGKEASAQWGMAQVPAFAWKALMRANDPTITGGKTVGQQLEDVMEYATYVAGGAIVSGEIHLFYGTGGGAGRGAGAELLEMVCEAFSRRAPSAVVSKRVYVMDGHSFLRCGNRVDRNGATGAAQILCEVTHTPHRRVGYDERFNLCSLPLVGADREARNLYVREFGATISSRVLYEAIESQGANDAVNLEYGNVIVLQPSFYGRINRNDLIATAAHRYSDEIKGLVVEDRRSLKAPEPVREIIAAANLTAHPPRDPEQVGRDLAEVGLLPHLTEELLGRYQAAASVNAILPTSLSKGAAILLDSELRTMDDILQVLANGQHLSTLIPLAINKAKRARARAAKSAAQRDSYTISHLHFIYGTSAQRWCAWRSYTLIAESSSRRVRELVNAAKRSRKAREEAALAAEGEAALNNFWDYLNQVIENIRQQLHDTSAALSQLAKQGTMIEGLNLLPLKDILLDLLRASSFQNHSEHRLADVLLSAVQTVPVDTLARQVFSYTRPSPASPQFLAELLLNAQPEAVATDFGGLNRSQSNKRVFYFLPLTDADLREVQEAINQLTQGIRIAPIGKGGGMCVVKQDVYWVETEGHVITPLYKQLLEEMAKDSTDYALSMTPRL